MDHLREGQRLRSGSASAAHALLHKGHRETLVRNAVPGKEEQIFYSITLRNGPEFHAKGSAIT